MDASSLVGEQCTVWSTKTKVLFLEGSDGCFLFCCENMIFVCKTGKE